MTYWVCTVLMGERVPKKAVTMLNFCFREELSKYKMLYTSHVHAIKGAKERLREMEEEATVLGTKMRFIYLPIIRTPDNMNPRSEAIFPSP